MKINNLENNIEKSNYIKRSNSNSPEQKTVSVQEKNSSIKITISKEGLKNYQNNINEKKQSTYEVMTQKAKERPKELITPQGSYHAIFNQTLFQLGSSVHAFEGNRDYILLEAYAKHYDQIVQGYADGTREIYMINDDPKTGHHKMTLEEELHALDKSYQREVLEYEKNLKMLPQLMNQINEDIKRLSSTGKHRSKLKMLIAARNTYNEILEKGIPENILDRMMSAKNAFIQKYSQNTNAHFSVDDLLSGIEVIYAKNK